MQSLLVNWKMYQMILIKVNKEEMHSYVYVKTKSSNEL